MGAAVVPAPCTGPALDSLKRYIRQYGLPQSVYLDKHTTYKSWAKPTLDEQLTDQQPRSQVERCLAELGIAVIHANSPQAKGRVERLFKTLQDRLVRELRLLGMQSVAAANAFLQSYLPTYNRRFARPTASPADLYRPAPSSRALDRVLCIKEERTVKNDSTLAHHGALYQLTQATRAKKVTVEARLDEPCTSRTRAGSCATGRSPRDRPEQHQSHRVRCTRRTPGSRPRLTRGGGDCSQGDAPRTSLLLLPETGHFYFGRHRPFLFWVDKRALSNCSSSVTMLS